MAANFSKFFKTILQWNWFALPADKVSFLSALHKQAAQTHTSPPCNQWLLPETLLTIRESGFPHPHANSPPPSHPASSPTCGMIQQKNSAFKKARKMIKHYASQPTAKTCKRRAVVWWYLRVRIDVCWSAWTLIDWRAELGICGIFKNCFTNEKWYFLHFLSS